MLSSFLLPFTSIPWIFKKHLRIYTIIPILLNLIFIYGVYQLGDAFSDDIASWIIPDWMSFGFITTALEWLIMAILVLAMFFTFTIFANIIAAPFLSYLARRTEMVINGTVQDENIPFDSILKEAPVIMAYELKKSAYILIRYALLFILMLIPVINVIAPVAWFVIGAWMQSIEYMDYSLSNKNRNFKDSRAKISKYKYSSLALGSGVSILLMIPVVNILTLPASTIAATRQVVVNQSKI